jgi:NADPH:quinone reductase-like Zn-dependent oxidoreductase
MVTTHKSEYAENSSTPGTTREWRHNVLDSIPLYGAHNLPPPPQRAGAAGGKVLLKTTHLVPGHNVVAALVHESFHPEFHMGQRVLAPGGWREWTLVDAVKTPLLPLPPGTKPEEALIIKALGADALFSVRDAGGEAIAEGSPDDAAAVSEGPKVLVTGAHTGQGLLVLQALRLEGVEEVRALVSEGGERAVGKVKEVGRPTRVFEQAEEMRDQGEVDVVVCCGGVEGIWVARRGGRVLIVGNAEVEDEEEFLEVAVSFSDEVEEHEAD